MQSIFLFEPETEINKKINVSYIINTFLAYLTFNNLPNIGNNSISTL